MQAPERAGLSLRPLPARPPQDGAGWVRYCPPRCHLEAQMAHEACKAATPTAHAQKSGLLLARQKTHGLQGLGTTQHSTHGPSCTTHVSPSLTTQVWLISEGRMLQMSTFLAVVAPPIAGFRHQRRRPIRHQVRSAEGIAMQPELQDFLTPVNTYSHAKPRPVRASPAEESPALPARFLTHVSGNGPRELDCHGIDRFGVVSHSLVPVASLLGSKAWG